MISDWYSDTLFIYSFIGIGIITVLILLLCFWRRIVTDSKRIDEQIRRAREEAIRHRHLSTISVQFTPNNTVSSTAAIIDDQEDQPPSYEQVMREKRSNVTVTFSE